MRPLLPRLALLAVLAGGLAAADAVSAFGAAFAAENADAKRAAVRALASKAAADDDAAYPLLVQALGDRQARDAAIAALRARTGLAPPSGKGGGGYPGYPAADTPGEWAAWLAARKAARDNEAKLELALKAAEAAKKAAGGEDAADPAAPAEGDAPETATKAAPAPKPSSDLGRLDRVVFKTGGALVCYVIGKRVDESGNLISLRVIHRDEGGEEVLTADLVARLEEDIE